MPVIKLTGFFMGVDWAIDAGMGARLIYLNRGLGLVVK
jgi:hypothetical protein